jgi:hypothetical protein
MRIGSAEEAKAMLLSILLLLQEPARDGVPVEPAPAQEIRGRLLDALTGAPVAGATCELWSEDFDEVARLAESTKTRADGRYELRPRSHDEFKVRLSAPDYRSTVTSLAGGVELLYPNDEPGRPRSSPTPRAVPS